MSACSVALHHRGRQCVARAPFFWLKHIRPLKHGWLRQRLIRSPFSTKSLRPALVLGVGFVALAAEALVALSVYRQDGGKTEKVS